MFSAQHLLAEGEKAQTGGFSPLLLMLGLMVIFLVFTMFRNRKRMQKAHEERETKLVPGAEVMTTAGIFGTVVDTFKDENKVLLELSPGNRVMFHIQAIAQFPQESVADTASTDEPKDQDGLGGSQEPGQR
ncbi:preprotein translocase subunit YajC [Pseudoglutamicibacter cumminsii]|uniref:preprotein translocase subunit YajC n=1 Tax=Pseudoglutamicibacter cumminsii TaxID=156979 RepID=UPI001957D2D2|nr:preprotein translocase subunit YajC [Pseudoglutamicibacter cumminsii]